MIIRELEKIKNTDKEVFCEKGKWVSRRLINKEDQLGFSFHDSIIYSNKVCEIHYKHHIESVYCISGEGELVDKNTNQKISLKPGVLYALDKHDQHILTAYTDLRIICVFSPPLTGNEQHANDGSYPEN